jgi:Ca2+-binding EF-hand superfamily protein
MKPKAITLIAAAFIVGTISTAALAVSKRTSATAEGDVRQVVRMMDKDRNGAVSKDEFIQFMGRTFDRLDVNKSGTLERKELLRAAIPRAVLRDCVHRAFPECGGE